MSQSVYVDVCELEKEGRRKNKRDRKALWWKWIVFSVLCFLPVNTQEKTATTTTYEASLRKKKKEERALAQIFTKKINLHAKLELEFN